MPDFSDVPSSSEVTRLLKTWGHREEGALGRLVPLVQAELRRLAHRCKSRENPRHTLQTTALVKRGTGAVHVSLDEALVVTPEQDARILALDAGLTELAALYPRQSQVVELGFFGGLEVKEVAEVLKTSPETVTRDWRFAKFIRCAP